MIGNNKAVGFTFLWGLAYGFVVSIVLYFVMIIAISTIIKNNNSITSVIENTQNVLLFGAITSLAGGILTMYLTFSKSYSYGLADCKETPTVPLYP